MTTISASVLGADLMNLGGEIRRMGEWMLDAAAVVTAGGTPDCEVTPAMLASMA